MRSLVSVAMYVVTTSATVCAIAGDADDGMAGWAGPRRRAGMARIRSAMSCFCTLPVGVRGSSSRKCTRCGTLKFASSFRQRSFTLATVGWAPVRTMATSTTSPSTSIRHGKGRALLHAFHVVDDLLDLPGKNILPADIDHVLAPADDVDVAGLVEGTQVPAPVIAVAGEDLRVAGLHLPVREIATEHRLSFEHDFSDLPRAHRLVVRVDDLEVEPGQDAKPLLHGGLRLDLKSHVAGRFRHAESLDEIAVEEGGDPVNQRGVERGAAGENPAQVRKLQRLDAVGLAHQLQHRRHQLDDRDMLVGQELADLLEMQLVLVEDVARA